MHPGGYYPRANAPSGRYGSGNGGPPYSPPPPEHQMTPREKEQVLMAAGRLAAEFLVDRGDLPPDVLDNRPPPPPPPIPFQHGPPPPARAFRFHGRPPAPPQQQHRPFHFQGQQPQRPHAPQWRFQGPRQFQGGHGPFPKRPRHGPPRSFPYGPRAPAPPAAAKTTMGCVGQGGRGAPRCREYNARR